ncbi:multicopper oxidase domain-containing protein [Frateuria hangzhouensis]|uniref:multicopper oxidase domain-containing protein n=1 Tax=Frateuria hangzhouensis TaxID=2995589 RepID=UPI0022608E0A|nr:multicopper oxidase domain-containing protein [Frateuria sp. STR12]MCX7515169.1 multicopper oxidase domain-containing protein [Frateuria sp. STR12]
MAHVHVREQFSEAWPGMAKTALRVAFGLIWLANAAFTWTSGFAAHYVGYLHNAADGQPRWSAWWFDFWIWLVTPNATLFVWLTRGIETLLALALVLGIARKTTYLAGALFSLLVWSTAEGFGGPYSVGAANMGTGIVYVLVFIALSVINSGSGPSPYSLDYYIERSWPRWRRVSEWRTDVPPAAVHPVSWRVQAPALIGIAVLVFFLVAGLHSSLNVRPPTPTAAAAAVSPLSLVSSQPIAKPRDARLPPLQAGSSVDVHVIATDDAVEIASGVQYQAWTFGGTVPGPVIHVRQGQTVNVTFTNKGTMQHSLDFHAAITPPNLHYVDIMPGKSLTYSFVANVSGAFLYHCGTPPVLLHIGNGMYGALIVDPAEPLPPAEESYVLVQGEWYTQQVSGKLMGADFQKMSEERPDEVVFNGAAFQYRDHPLPVTPGERTRIYLVNAGPNLWSAFHVIGAIFDKVYPDGDPAHALSGVSTYTVGPGEGAVFDLVMPDAGEYTFVDHDMAHASLGAIGVLAVGGPAAAPAEAPGTAGTEPAAPPVAGAPPAAPAGPYKFDPARGATLYATNCAACHQATGMGLPGAFPPLKGDPTVLNPDPAKQIGTILHGMHGQAVGGTVYATPMPPFADVLNDHDVADIANHERTSWGNQGKPVTAEQVKAVRAAQ